MNINNFLKMPLVKIVVTVLFLFYVYDKTKDDPRTASYQLKKADIGQSVDAIKYAMKVAKDSSSGQSAQQADSENYVDIDGNQNRNNSFSGPIVFEDVLVGNNGPEIVCGSQIAIQYSLIEKNDQNLINQSNMSLKIGSGFNKLIEKGILGMRPGGVRIIDIPKNFSSGDSNYDYLIKNKQMIYKILLITAANPQTPETGCE